MIVRLPVEYWLIDFPFLPEAKELLKNTERVIVTVLYAHIAPPFAHPVPGIPFLVNTDSEILNKTLLFSALIAPPEYPAVLSSKYEFTMVVVDDFKLIAPP